jgi:hypothetical protein
MKVTESSAYCLFNDPDTGFLGGLFNRRPALSSEIPVSRLQQQRDQHLNELIRQLGNWPRAQPERPGPALRLRHFNSAADHATSCSPRELCLLDWATHENITTRPPKTKEVEPSRSKSYPLINADPIWSSRSRFFSA